MSIFLYSQLIHSTSFLPSFVVTSGQRMCFYLKEHEQKEYDQSLDLQTHFLIVISLSSFDYKLENIYRLSWKIEPQQYRILSI